MNCKNTIPQYLNQQISQLIVLESRSGSSRHNYLQEWLNQSEIYGAKILNLSCNRAEEGPWAGVKDLFGKLLPELQVNDLDLITKYDYELVHVLPTLRRTLSLRYTSLTDKSPDNRKLRTYPADWVVRIIHGLINLFTAWCKRCGYSQLIVVFDHFDNSGPLLHQFCVELMRRCAPHLSLTLILVKNPGTSENIASQFDPNLIKHYVKLDFPPEESSPIDKNEMTYLAQKLEIQVEKDEFELEDNLSKLIHYWLLSDQPQKALSYQFRACSIYTKRGYYEDVLLYSKPLLDQLETIYRDDQYVESVHSLIGDVYLSHTALGESEQALAVLEVFIKNTTDPDFLRRHNYWMAMLYARYLPNRDFDKALMFLNQGLKEVDQENWSMHKKILVKSSYQRGLSLIAYRQNKVDEAIEIGLSAYNMLHDEFGDDQYVIDQSILLFTVAQVYAAIGAYDQALFYFTEIISMDPEYCEYHNERGNLYVKMGRSQDAMNDYLKTIDLSPPYPEGWTNLGQAYLQIEDAGKAVEAYTVSLDLNPSQTLALVGRAQAFELLGEQDLAAADYTASLTLDQNQPLVLANRAILHYDAERYQEALEDMNQAITLSPETSDLYQNRAIALTSLGRSEDAIRDLQTYLKLEPEASDRFEVERKLLTLQENMVSV
jgi:tetratricopeptide (TPR) repeat protein